MATHAERLHGSSASCPQDYKLSRQLAEREFDPAGELRAEDVGDGDDDITHIIHGDLWSS